MYGWNVLRSYTRRTLGNQLPLNQQCYLMLITIIKSIVKSYTVGICCYCIREKTLENQLPLNRAMLLNANNNQINCSIMYGWNVLLLYTRRTLGNQLPLSRTLLHLLYNIAISWSKSSTQTNGTTDILTFARTKSTNQIECQIMHGSNLLLLYTRRTLGNQLILNRPMLLNGNANNKIDC